MPDKKEKRCLVPYVHSVHDEFEHAKEEVRRMRDCFDKIKAFPRTIKAGSARKEIGVLVVWDEHSAHAWVPDGQYGAHTLRCNNCGTRRPR